MSKKITVTENGDHYEFDWEDYKFDAAGAIIALSYALGHIAKRDVKGGHVDGLIAEIGNLITTVVNGDDK